MASLADKAKSKIVNGVRVDLATGKPTQLADRRKVGLSSNLYDSTGNQAGQSLSPIVSSATLAAQPDFNLPPVAPPTETAGLLGTIKAGTDQFTQNLQSKRDEAATQRQDSLQNYLDSLMSPGKEELTAELYSQKGGVDTLQNEINDINQQILQEQTALARRTEAIQKEAGLTKGQIDQQVAEESRVSARKQADLYIIQMGIQGRYDSAKAIADRAVSVQVERQKTLQDALKNIYDDNKDLFTTAEQRLFETQLSDRERELNKEEESQKRLYDFAIEAVKNGASTSVMQSILSSGSPEVALAKYGRYLVKPTAASAPKLQNFGTSDNPVWRQYNYKTGTWETVSGLGTSGLSPQQVTEIDNAISESQVALDVIDNILANKRGIGAITGQVQAPGISGFFQGGKAGGKGAFDSGLTRYVPVVGNIQGAIQSRNDRDNVLTDLSYIYNTEGFQEFIGLKQSGLTFGNLSGGERQAIFAAAGRLNSALELEKTPGGDVSGKVIGYRGTDDKLIEDLQLVAKGLKEYQDEKNAQLTLGQDDKLEIINTP